MKKLAFVLIYLLILCSGAALVLLTTVPPSGSYIAASPHEPPAQTIDSHAANHVSGAYVTMRWDEHGRATELLSYPDVVIRTSGSTSPLVQQVSLTFSYSIIGPAGASSPPVLTYTSNGQSLTASLNAKLPTTFAVDAGSTWSVTGTLAGSNTAGRWTTVQPTTGTATTDQTINLVYYRQFYVEFSLKVVGGGSGIGNNAATVTFQQFGKNISALTGSSEWVDTSSPFTYGFVLAGSTSSQRWATNSSSGTVTRPGTVSRTFFHQFAVTFAYRVLGGGTLGVDYYDPSIAIVQFGLNSTTTPGTSWIDSGSSYHYPITLAGSSSDRRWFTGTTTGTVYGPSTTSRTYYLQFFVTVSYSVIGGGSPGGPILLGSSLGVPSVQAVTSGGWLDAGSTYQLSAGLSGSNSTERWVSTAPVSGSVFLGASVSGVFYNQYAIRSSFEVVGGGSPPSAPTLHFSALGTTTVRSLQLNTPTVIWIDAGSQYTLDQVLGGSSQTERWKTGSSGVGTVIHPESLDPLYYHQFFIKVSFSVVNGNASLSPTFSFSSYGAANSSALIGTQPTVIWADQGPYSVTSAIGGSNSTSERWAAIPASGLIAGPGPITITYHHQYYLVAIGTGATSQWFDAGTTGTLSIQGVHGRNQTSGSRITAYSLDGGTPISAPPTRGLLNVSVRMDSAHKIVFSSVTQYHIVVDVGIVGAVNSSTTTPPTIAGDDYWYDSGMAVKVALSGVWGRTGGGGTGQRLTVYSVNGGPSMAITTSGTMTVLSISSISSAQSITGRSVNQYNLLTTSGSVTSITSPTIPGDAGWYDSGTRVTATYDYSWLVTAGQSRMNAVASDVDGAGRQTLSRQGNGTFSVSTSMDRPHKINIASVEQYHLTITGGDSLVISMKSQTSDNYYDSGSVLTVRAAYSWNIVNGSSRTNLASYIIDGRTTEIIPRLDAGSFTFPQLTFDTYHTLVLNGVSQYLVSFVFTDSSGSRQISLTSVQIDLAGDRIVNVTGPSAWLDANSTFRMSGIRWEGSDVSPVGSATYTITRPQNLRIQTRVYEAEISVSNSFGGPAQGKAVHIDLANGTSITRTTDAQGQIVLQEIPLGKFNATISGLFGDTRVMGDAAIRPVTDIHIAADTLLLGSVGGILLAGALLGAWIFARRRRRNQHSYISSSYFSGDGIVSSHQSLLFLDRQDGHVARVD